MERLLRRAQLPMSMSEGFHPKIRMSFPSALALGLAGEEEVIELDFSEPIVIDDVIARLNRFSMGGLVFHSAKSVSAGRKKSTHMASVFEMTIPKESVEITTHQMTSLLSKSSVLVVKHNVVKHNGKQVDARSVINTLTLDGCCLKMELGVTEGADAGFREILDQLGLGEQLFRTIFPIRKKVILADQ